MTYYRSDGSTRGHGIWGGIFSLLILSGCITLLVVIRAVPTNERVIAYLIGVPVTLVACWVFAFSLRHVLRPQTTFVEITHERISWRDWHGFGMTSMDYPLASVRALKRPDEASDCLILSDGTAVALPVLAIQGFKEFMVALKQASPAITLLDSHDNPTP
jgi:hypothetical protein